MQGLGERPCFYPCFQFGNRDDGQQGDVWTAPLNRIQKALVFEVADEDVFFVLRQGLVVGSVLRNIDFLWSPKKRQLFFNQLFKNRMLLLVITCDIDVLTKKHRLCHLIVGRLAKGAVG